MCRSACPLFLVTLADPDTTAKPALLKHPLLPFAALSASYFAHIGFFNPYLPLWLKELGLSITLIGLLTAVQAATRVLAPYAWGRLSDHTGERVKLLRFCAGAALLFSIGLWFDLGVWGLGLDLRTKHRSRWRRR